ncbi:hypothetical protein OMP38_15200 [Cohnella ginsengisoli]|uniref:Uncharacterized protein n=1 Tax=Cohnella ginsengisoli TaxID=425004 RepID=A0A9X4KGW8_9BACL|nr:hypothetical protein [Cohnella ginsengisoli]MDG0792059.1 hypothetical protein [Cohnella ginsengisoli]
MVQLEIRLIFFFVVATFLYAFFSNLTSLYFLRKAETKRATHLISNSLNVSLDEEETNLYYNNRQVPSIVRLGLNVFENSLHSKGTASIMVKRNLSVILVYLVIWLFMLLNRESSLDLLALLSQTLLTTTIITNFIKLVVLMFGFERSFQDCRNLFLTGIQETPEFYARILQIFTYYESLKASMGITLSSRIFDKYVNPTSTIKWEQIKHNLQIE